MFVVVHHCASCCPPARQQLWSASVAKIERWTNNTSCALLFFPDSTLSESVTVQPYHCCPPSDPLKMDSFSKPSRPSTIDKRVPLRRDESTETTRSSYVSTTPGSEESEWEEEERVHSPVEQTGTKKEAEPMSPVVVVCRCKMSASYRQILLTRTSCSVCCGVLSGVSNINKTR